MIKRLILFLLLSVYSVDSFSSHAAGMDITYEFIGSTATITGHQITVTVGGGNWQQEVSWEIYDPSGAGAGIIIASGGAPYSGTVCIPTINLGSLQFRMYDSFGDGWNGNTYTLSGNTTLSGQTTGTLNGGFSGVNTFNVTGGPTCSYEDLRYEITIAFYRECANWNATAPPSFEIRFEEWATNNNGGYSSANLPRIGPATNITPACQNITNPCTSNQLTYAYEKYIYKGVIILSHRDSWKIWNAPLSDRNTTTHGPAGFGADDLCVVANIDNTTYLSSSPVFSSDPISFLCTGGDCFYNGATDVDLDDLSYSLTQPKTDEGLNDNMTYQNGTYLQPFPASITTCDAITGDLCINTNVQGTSVAAIKVIESRNGTPVGFVTRDIQIWAKPCPAVATPPTFNVTPIPGFNSTNNRFDFCVDGSTVSFDIQASSTVPIDILNSVLPTGASFTTNPATPFSSNIVTGTFSWTPTIADTAGSPYVINFTINDDECPIPNSTSESYTIHLNGFDISDNFTPVTSCAPSNGTATVAPSGSGYSYSWNTTPVQTTATATGLSAGTYICTITDNNTPACILDSDPITVTSTVSTPTVTVTTNPASTSICGAGNPITLIANGSPGVTYSWDNGLGAGPSHTVTPPLNITTYTVTVTDPASNCENNAVIPITVNPLPPAVATSNPTTTCIPNNGTASVGPSVSGYSYSWNTTPVQTTATATGLGAGTYFCIVTNDVTGCYSNSNSTIVTYTGSSPIVTATATSTTISNATSTITICENDPITLTGSGTAGVTYDWLPNGVTDGVSFIPIATTTYTVVGTDAAGCTNNSTITVIVNDLSTVLANATSSTCFGYNNGFIDVNTTGGTPSYEYSIDAGANWQLSNVFSSLSAGPYTIDIKDADNCTNDITVTLTDPPLLTVSPVSSDVSCFGLNDGSIDLDISGGTSPFVSWLVSPSTVYPSTSEYISNLSPAVYIATIDDVNGCGGPPEYFVINEPPEITIFGTPNPTTCFGDSDGSIVLLTTGSDSWNWTDSSGFTSSNKNIYNLEAGTYTVTAFDASRTLCTEIVTYVVTEPSDIVVTNVVPDHVSCFGLNDGSIDLTITGGTGILTVNWTATSGIPILSTSSSIFNLSADVYTATITDDNGCSPSINNSPITIVEPLEHQLVPILINDETCYGDVDGSIDLDITDGDPPFTYQWTGPNGFTSTSLDISLLAAGTYNLQITDKGNCIFYHPYSIDIGNAIQIDTTINHINCYGDADGSIELLANGVPPYTYDWTGPNGVTSGTTTSSILEIEDLAAGDYFVIVSDVDVPNCPNGFNVSILEPDSLSLTAILTDESCEYSQDGQIEVSVSGGTPNYSYIWPNGTTDSIISNLANGEYILNIMDGNSCFLTETFQLDLFLFDTIRQVTNVSCWGDFTGSVDLDIIGGNPPFTYQWTGPNGFSSINDSISNLSTGVYTIEITDSIDCIISRNVVVSQPQQQLSAVTYDLVDVLCYGDSTGSIRTTIVGGTSPYVLDWGSSDTSQMWAGTHSFIVTDTNGCNFTDSINIQQNDSIQITATITDAQCYGYFNGSVELDITQGSSWAAPYEPLWSGPNNYFSTSEDIYNLESGDYSVIVTNAHGCRQFLNLFVDQPQQLSQTTTINTSNYSGYKVRCKGENSAWIDISISGGYPPFTYLWNNGDITDSIFNLYAGDYSLQITDNLGCTDNLSIIVDEPPTYVTVDVIATSDYNGYNISCFGVNDGSVFAEASNGVGPDYTYLWNNNDKKDSITGISSGYYEVFVYDKNLCLAIDSVTLSEPSELFFDLLSYPDTCEKSVGKAEFIASGGVPNYSAIWSDSSTTNIVHHFTEGTYSVEVSDSNSCKKSASFSIDNLESPISDFEAYPYHKRLLDQKNEPFYFVDLTNTFSDSVEYWTWNFGDGFFDYDSLVSHSYDSAGTYTVNLEITTFANCTDTISKDVLVDEYSFYIPTTFIPSSSEVENRIFKGYGIGVEEYELKIFSSWGGLIFKSNDLDVGWDGRHKKSDYNNFNKEDLCPAGVYSYTVFIKNIYGEVFEYQGQVKLLR